MRSGVLKLGQDLRIQDYGRLIIGSTSASSPIKVFFRKDNFKFIKFYKEYNYLYDQFFEDDNSFDRLLNNYIEKTHPTMVLINLKENPEEKIFKSSSLEAKRYLDYFQNLLIQLEPQILSKYGEVDPGLDRRENETDIKMEDEILDTLRSLGYIN